MVTGNICECLSNLEKGSISEKEVLAGISKNEIVLFRGEKTNVLAGKPLAPRINTSIGISNIDSYRSEVEKIKGIGEFQEGPDIMMDLSIVESHVPLYKIIQGEIGCPVGTIPYYTCFDEEKGIDDKRLIEKIENLAADGISFMTMHFTGSNELLQASKHRRIPVISRGGSLILRDMIINDRKENILLSLMEDIIKIIKKYEVVLSIGTTFRPSSIFDALDDVQWEELKLQKGIAKYLMNNGVKVIMEGVGHLNLKQIESYTKKMRDGIYIPFMPLGPIPTDRAIGADNISNAIGATFMIYQGGADIINSVTKEEHTGGIPNINSIEDAIRSAKVVVKTIEELKFYEALSNEKMGTYVNCMNKKSETVGCSRCSFECPFKLNERLFDSV